MKRSIVKIQGYYKRQLISAGEFLQLAEESTAERWNCGEISIRQARRIMASLYIYVGEQEKRRAI